MERVYTGGMHLIEYSRTTPGMPCQPLQLALIERAANPSAILWIVPMGQGMLRRALHEYVAHYQLERNHQGLGNGLITPRPVEGHQDGPIGRRPRLGGILNYYERCAA